MKRLLLVALTGLGLAASAAATPTVSPAIVSQKMLTYLNTKGIYSRPLQPYKAGAVSCQRPATATVWFLCSVTIVYSNGAPGSHTSIWHARLDAAGNVHYHVG